MIQKLQIYTCGFVDENNYLIYKYSNDTFKKVKNYHLYNVPVKAHDEINNGKSGLKVYYKDCATHFWEGGDCDSFFNKNVDD